MAYSGGGDIKNGTHTHDLCHECHKTEAENARLQERVAEAEGRYCNPCRSAGETPLSKAVYICFWCEDGFCHEHAAKHFGAEHSGKEDLTRERDALQARVEEAERHVNGMREEGCAALGLVENIFNGLTAKGKPTDPVLAQMAEAAAKLLLAATPCGHKALAERQKEALAGLREDLRVRLDASTEGTTVADGLVNGEDANRSWRSWLFDVMSTHGDIARAAIEEGT
jgi:hypothetical protein